MDFLIYRSSDAQYYFVVKSRNSEIVATSEMYTTKQSAKNTIESMKNNINPNSTVIDMAK